MDRDFCPAPLFVLSVEGDLHGLDTPGNRELIRRIEACVRACDGISTEELEQGVVGQMRQLLQDIVPVLQSRQATLQERTLAAA